MQRHSAPESEDDRPTIIFDRSELAGDPIESLLAGWPGPSRRLALRHWMGIGSLAAVILAAAVSLPPLVVSSDGNEQAASPVYSSAGGSDPGARAPVPPTVVSGLPSTSAAPAASSSAGSSSTPVPSADAGAHPTRSGGAPATTAPKVVTTPHPGTTSGGDASRFSAVTVQAEAPENQLSGGAQTVACALCSGGGRVRYLGRVDVHLTIPAAGRRTLTVVYEVDGSREVDISVNGGTPLVASLTGTGWESPATTTFSVTIPAGQVTVGFYNVAGDCPDIDAVTVS